MPLPRVIARLNKRYTNRFIEPIVARHSGYVVLHHQGRRTGNAYETPIFTFEHADSRLVALTYGAATDWAQNVMAGSAAIVSEGRTLTIDAASVVGRDVAWPSLPRIVRVSLWMLRVDEFLLLAVSPRTN